MYLLSIAEINLISGGDCPLNTKIHMSHTDPGCTWTSNITIPGLYFTPYSGYYDVEWATMDDRNMFEGYLYPNARNPGSAYSFIGQYGYLSIGCLDSCIFMVATKNWWKRLIWGSVTEHAFWGHFEDKK